MWRPVLLIVYAIVLSVSAQYANRNNDLHYSPDKIASVEVGFHPGYRVWENAKHLWTTGNFERPEYEAVSELLRDNSQSNTAENPVWQDLYALTLDGKFYPKHQQLITYLAAVSYGAFGDSGAWALDTIALVVLFVVLYFLALQFASPESSLLLIIILPWIERAWIRTSVASLHIVAFDLIGATILITGLALTRGFPMIGGLVLGLTLNIRVTWIIYAALPFISKYLLSKRRSIFYITGLLFTFLLVAASNYQLFGDALRGPYARLPQYIGGVLTFDTSSHTVSIYYLAEIFQRLFSGGEDGWITTAPYLLLVFVSLFIKEMPTQLRSISVAAILLAAPHFFYTYWLNCSGTRFVLPTTLLLSLPLAWTFDFLSDKYERRRRDSV